MSGVPNIREGWCHTACHQGKRSEAVDVVLLALLPAAAHNVQLVVQDGRRAVAALDVRHSCKLPRAAPTVVSVVVRHLVGEPGRPEAPDPDVEERKLQTPKLSKSWINSPIGSINNLLWINQ